MLDTRTTFTNPIAVPGAPEGSVTFTKMRTDANGVTTWVAPGAEDSLDAQIILKRSAQKTKAGIVGRTVHLTVPRQNPGTLKYDSSIQARITINAPSSSDHDESLAALMMIVNLFAEADPSVGFTAEFVEAADLPL
jgi:hypothetical protein